MKKWYNHKVSLTLCCNRGDFSPFSVLARKQELISGPCSWGYLWLWRQFPSLRSTVTCRVTLTAIICENTYWPYAGAVMCKTQWKLKGRFHWFSLTLIATAVDSSLSSRAEPPSCRLGISNFSKPVVDSTLRYSNVLEPEWYLRKWK